MTKSKERLRFLNRLMQMRKVNKDLQFHAYFFDCIFDIVSLKGLPDELKTYYLNIHSAHAAMSVILVCQLFQNSRNQEYNLYKLLNIIKHNLEDNELESQLSEIDTKKWYTKLSSQDKMIRKFKELRDGNFAHIDPNNNGWGMSNKALFTFNNLASEIIDDVLVRIGNKHLISTVDTGSIKQNEHAFSHLYKYASNSIKKEIK